MDATSKSSTLPFVVLAAFILQINTPAAAQTSGIEDNNFDKTIRIYDPTGKPMRNSALDAAGSPLFLPNWKQGWLRLGDGRVFTVPLRLDLEQQEVHYRRSDGTDVDVEPGQIKGMGIIDTISGNPVQYQFLSGFPAIDNQTETSFYLLLDSGRVSLLESLRKKIYQDRNAYAANFVKEYRLYTDLYVVAGGKMIRIKKDEKFFRQLTKDKQAQMDDYLSKNKVSFKSVDDIRQLIHYYNGLP